MNFFEFDPLYGARNWFQERRGRTPGYYLKEAFGAKTWQQGNLMLRESSGVGFAEGAYWKYKQYGADKWGASASAFDSAEYYGLRAKGTTHSAAANQLWRGQLFGNAKNTAPIVKSPGLRTGWLAGGLGVAYAAYEATNHEAGPIVGGTSFLAGVYGGGIGARMGANVGAAFGAAIGSFLPGPGNIIGAGIGYLVGGLTGMIAPSLAMDALTTTLPNYGFRISRRGFGNIGHPYVDTRINQTMRQASLSAISQSSMNARNALGGEAALLHFA
jgi:hypothetical protein